MRKNVKVALSQSGTWLFLVVSHPWSQLVTQRDITRLIDNELSRGGLLETNMVNPVSCSPIKRHGNHPKIGPIPK